MKKSRKTIENNLVEKEERNANRLFRYRNKSCKEVVKIKRIIALVICAIIVLSMAFSLVGCGENKEKSSTADEKIIEVTEVETKAPTIKATEKPTEVSTEAPKTEHQHDWENITNTIHHSAETESVWVVDQPAQVKEFKIHYYQCASCLSKWEYDSGIDNESKETAIYTLTQEHLVQCKENYKKKMASDWVLPPIYPRIDEWYETYTQDVPEEGHYENRVVKEAYDETKVTGKRCKDCGVTEMFDE